MQFTPMASPSTTPYHMNSDFTIPGDFFSPLTSPALHAQNTSNMHHQFMPQPQGFYTNPSTAASSAAPSPVDPNKDVEMGGDGTNSESLTQPKKPSRRKPATPRTFALNKVKQSPIQKPQKRKSVALSSADADLVVQDAHKSGHIAPRSAGFQMPPPLESSENDSVSPEQLSDIPMGPPPRPGSAYQSPALVAQRKDISGPAATPKSLLSTKSVYDANGPASTGISGQMGQASLEDLELPEAVDGVEGEQPTATIVQVSNSQEHTPRLSASRKTPKLGPLSTPSSNRPPSISGSPAIGPMTASTPAGLLKDKKDARGGRGASKKRGSVCTTSSALASPAILPRVSPSIKPLLPEGSKLTKPVTWNPYTQANKNSQPTSTHLHMRSYSPQNQITRIFWRAIISLESPTPTRCPPVSPASALLTKLPSKVAATASTMLSKRCNLSFPHLLVHAPRNSWPMVAEKTIALKAKRKIAMPR